MAVISVQSPTTGVSYTVQIGGDTPTPTEQERINQYIAQQDAAVQGMMGGQSSSGAGEDTSWRGAVSYGLDQPLENIAITSNLLGGEGFGSFLSNLTDAPQGYQSATESFMEEDGFLSKLSYLPRAAVEQTGQFVGSVASRLAGSVLGGALGSAVAPGPGTVTGAGIGAFAGPAIFEGVQVLGPVALERARNNGRDVPNAEDWAGAFGTAAASGALNAIAPGLSGFFKKVAVEAGTEAVQSIVQQSGGSVATEAGLQVDPYQAVQEGILGGAGAAIITAPSAILGREKEAAEDVLDKIDADILEDQPEILDQISRGIIAEEGVPEQPATTDAAEAFRAFVPPKPLGLPAPQAGSLAAIAGAGQPTTTPAQTPATGQAIGAEVPSVEVSPFRWSQYEAAKQSIIESGDATVPNIARAASSAGQPVTPAVAKKIRSQLEQDGVITADPKAKGKYRSTPESVKPVAMDESLRRSISDVTRDLEEARAARAKAEQDARRAAESGKKAEATVASRALSAADSMVKTSEATLNDLTARLAQAPAASTVPTTERPASRRVGMQAVIPAAQEPTAAAGAVAAQADIQTKEGRDAAVAARAGRLTQAAENYTAQAQQKIAAASSIEAQGRKVQLPKSEADRIASLRAEAARDMDAAKNLRSAAERASSDVQKMRERQAAEAARQVAAAAAKSNRTPEYDARQAQLTNAMRKRLDGLGLKDIDVRGAPILEIEEARKGVLVEGMFDVEDGKRVISLSMGIYEPGASEADTLKKIAAVMDHEVIHALRNLGVIKEAEWKSLSSLAARQKYMREKDGKTVERQYTYLQRAERMNAELDAEGQIEEAVAEMYRDFAAGRLKIGGRPRSVMERIRDFFRAIIRSHKDIGITDPAQLFEAIKSGQVGARGRVATETVTEPEADVAPAVRAQARQTQQQSPQPTSGQVVQTKTKYETPLERIGAIPIPYDTRLWDAARGTATYANGTSRIIEVGGRKVVIMDINGKRVPFYLSTGRAGKASVAPGKWYPFFGVSNNGWINKGSEQQINDFYGSSELRDAADKLNSEIGNVLSDTTIPEGRLKGRHIDAINEGMSPVENGEPDTLTRFEENVRSVLAEISAPRPKMSRVSATEQGAGRAGAERPVASRLRDTAGYLAELRGIEVENLGIDQADVEAARAAMEGDVDSGTGFAKRKYSRRSTAGAMSPKTKKKVQANQSALMYARSADTIAKVLQLGKYGLEERRARQIVDGVLRRFQDSVLPVGRMIQELSAKGMDIVDAMDTYLQEEIMSRKTGALIEKNTKDMYEPMVALVKKLNVPAQRIDQLKRASTSAAGQKGFVERAIEQYGSSKMALAEAYLYARHAKERNRYILENKDDQNTKGSGMSDAEADAILRWFEALDPANKKVVADIGKYARLIVANTNQTRVDGGLISRDLVNAEEGDANQGTSYGFYVPLRGIINEDLASVDDAQYMPPATPRYGARGKEDRTALGRAEYASDILANLMTQNQNAIVRAERNKVGQSFLRLLRADPTMTDEYARILPTPPKVRQPVGGKIRMVPDPMAYKNPYILVVKEDGKETFVQFDDLSLAGAMNGQNGFGPETGGALLRGMSMVNRYLASINTSYNPAFVITNVFRDIQTGLVNLNQFEIKGLSSEVAKNILPSIKGIAGAVLRGDTTSPWAKVYADFVESGGQNATNSFDTLEERVNDLRGLLSEISDAGSKSQWSRMKNSFVGQKGASLLNTVESINTAAENGIRVATYKALLDRGFTKERAAQAAGNVTVNFSKGGDYRRLLNGVFLFYNASIQGTFAMLNAATRSKKVQALWVGIMAAGLVNDMFNAMMSGEDDDGKLIYDKIPPHILQNNIILPDFLGIGDRSYISIPMPYGLNMAYNTGRSVSRFMRGNYSVAEATSSIFGTAVDVLNPIGSGDTFLDPNTVSPTILDPIVDLLSNEDFSGKPIYKEALGFDRTPDPASQRYWSTTSPSAVWIAKNLNSLFGGNEVRPGPLDVSPDVIQFWFEFLTGGVGRFVQQSGESIASVGTGDFGEGFIENFPVLNRVVRTVSEREDMSSYIEGAERVLTAEAELKRAREVGDQQWAQRTIQRYGAELRVVGQIRSAETALRRLSRQRGEIESNPRIPEAQKAVMLDRIEERRQQVLARANAVLSSLD